MTISEELQKSSDTIKSMEENVANAYVALKDNGATLPEQRNVENLANTVRSLPAGGGVGSILWTGTVDGYAWTELGRGTSANSSTGLYQPNNFVKIYETKQFPSGKYIVFTQAEFHIGASGVAGYGFLTTTNGSVPTANSATLKPNYSVCYIPANSKALGTTCQNISHLDLTSPSTFSVYGSIGTVSSSNSGSREASAVKIMVIPVDDFEIISQLPG